MADFKIGQPPILRHPVVNDCWMNKKNDQHYMIRFKGLMKIKEGEWIIGVVYISESNEIYIRDEETFLQKFDWCQTSGKYS